MMIVLTKFNLKSIIIFLILVVNVSVAESENLPVPAHYRPLQTTFENCDSVNLKPCTQESIKEYLISRLMRQRMGKTFYRNYARQFSEFLGIINCSECTVKENELKKILAVQFFELENDTSKLAKYMKDAVLTMIIFGGWGPDYERMLIQKAEDAKKKQDWPAYYDFVLELARHSPQQWFKYSMIFFHANDSIYSNGKRFHCLDLLNRFKETKDKGVSDTIVSMVYTMIKNDTVMFTIGLDELLVKFSEEYKYSNQRMEFYGRLVPYYEPLKNKVEWEYKWYVDYVNNVKKEMAKKKKLIDFVPPVKIE